MLVGLIREAKMSTFGLVISYWLSGVFQAGICEGRMIRSPEMIISNWKSGSTG